MKTFITRTITALFFVAIMLGGILWNELSFFLLFFLINFFALREYVKLVRLMDGDYNEVSPWHSAGLLIAGCAVMMAVTDRHFGGSGVTLGEIGFVMAFIFILLLPLGEILMSKNFSLKTIGYSILGLIYVTAPLSMMVDLRLLPVSFSVVPGWHTTIGGSGSVLIPLLLIVFIWINDTMAYIVGSLIGRTPFAPSISPKKTIEGTVGGMILAVAAAGVFGYFWGADRWGLAWPHWVALAVIAAVFGTAGDLLESRLKRLAGVKDSGSIMPGHGGFLDRFDSLLVAAPFAWIYVSLFVR
ncbi:phosphatidate cytidylyltransferase [Chitinophaga sp. GCM10012297]|uniref:Phosphatidate cytidylyltransferase n=1 Tax=Chitinophaga chungangae TaxID=2821488 RepID=A0ABS3YE71_9BACT|nr:phosphatidate cytidylyltransferase [Chitinophaga chungangae]MBO9152968.1 phosphatidate cytidylyltransferase [Chitinophaga chungangae]